MYIEEENLSIDELLDKRQELNIKLDNNNIDYHTYVSEMIIYDKAISRLSDKYNAGQ